MKQFIITKHARQMLLKRNFCRPEKFNKVVAKAWLSKECTDKKGYKKKHRIRKEKKYQYRYFMGYVFVFAPEGDKIFFITLYPAN